jgi:hypothetical protein
MGKIPGFVQGFNVFVGGGAGGEPEKFLAAYVRKESKAPQPKLDCLTERGKIVIRRSTRKTRKTQKYSLTTKRVLRLISISTTKKPILLS